jgi:hypothetical protein
MDEKEIKKKLNEFEYKVLREKATEKPFSGELYYEKRNGKYYHRTEIEAWVKEDDWSGQIQGTNEQNIFVFAGGWNCRHSIVGVPKALVPKEDIERVKAKYVELIEN